MENWKDFFSGAFTFSRRLIQIGVFIFFFIVYYTSHHQDFLIGSFYSFKIGPIHIVDPYIYLTYLGRNFFKATFYEGTFFGFLIPIILAFFFGRIFCSWLCPYNFLYEIIETCESFFKKRKSFNYFEGRVKTQWIWLIFSLLLGIFVVFLPYYLVLPGLLSVMLHQAILYQFNFISVGLFVVFTILLVDLSWKKRLWCKFLCPTGLILKKVSFKKALRVIKREDLACKKCALCSFNCPLGLTPHLANHQRECYNCGRCIDVCKKLHPDKPPLKFKFL